MSAARAEGWWRPPDRALLVTAALLLTAGMVLAAVASPHMAARHGLDSHYFALRHLLHVAVAAGVMLAVSQLGEREVRRLGVLVLLVSALAMALLPWFGTDFGKGSVRWFSLGPVSVQPSEFAKAGAVLTMAWFLSSAGKETGVPGKSLAFGTALGVVALLAVQPDIGQAALVILVWGIVYLLAGASPLMLISLAAFAALGGLLAYQFLSHVRYRVDVFLSGSEPAHSQLDKVDQALAQGGLLGRLMASDEARIRIPDGHSDFVVASITAEFGLIACLLLLLAFAVVAARSAWRVRSLRSRYSKLAAAGLSALIVLQALLHFGVNLRLLPTTGMTLPLVSYGGSSLLAAGFSMGAILALTRSRGGKDSRS